MKHAAILFSFICVLAFTLPVHSEEAPISPMKGKAIYTEHCARCHGIHGKGDGPDAAALIVPPTNFHRYESRIKSEKALRAAIIWGLAFSPMHGWWEKFSGAELRSLTAYIRQLAPYRPWRP